MEIQLDLKCNENITTLTQIDASSDECNAYFKYESVAGCSYVTMRPLWRLMDRISILNGTILIALGLVMVFAGKGVVVWTLGVTLTVLLTAIIFDIAINVLPRATTVADGILLALVCVMIFALSIFLSWGLTMIFEAVVPLVVSAFLFVLVSEGTMMLTP